VHALLLQRRAVHLVDITFKSPNRHVHLSCVFLNKLTYLTYLVTNPENNHCIQMVIRITTEIYSVVYWPTFPETSTQIRLEVFAQSCKQTDRQTTTKT